jgi:hypothetical protein
MARRHGNNMRIRFAVIGRRGVMIARTFIAQRALDQDKVGSLSGRRDLAR